MSSSENRKMNRLRENYERLREIFDVAITESDRYTIVYAYVVEARFRGSAIIRKKDCNCSSYILGFDAIEKEMILFPLKMSQGGVSCVQKVQGKDITFAKRNVISNEVIFHIRSHMRTRMRLCVKEETGSLVPLRLLLSHSARKWNHSISFMNTIF